MNGQQGGPPYPYGGGQQLPPQPQQPQHGAPQNAGAYAPQGAPPGYGQPGAYPPQPGAYPQANSQQQYGGYAQPPNAQAYAPPQGYGQPPQGYPQAQGGPQASGYGSPPQGYAPAPGYGAPARPGYGAPPQAGYGAPPQPGYGAPAQASYGAPPQPERSWASLDKPGAGPVAFPAPAPGLAVHEIGLFGAVPCPSCGLTTHTGSTGSAIARGAGGLIGVLIYSAVAVKYVCPSHGVIPKEAFPPHHRTAIDMRRLVKLGGAGALFLLILGLVMLQAVIR